MWIVVAVALGCQLPADVAGFRAGGPEYRVADLPVEVTVSAVDAAGEPVTGWACPAVVAGREVELTDGAAVLADFPLSDQPLTVEVGGRSFTAPAPSVRQLPGFLSLAPPLLAIALAIWLRQALLALFCGIWAGATFVADYNPLSGLLRTFDTYLPAQLADSGHASIIVFTMALGGMVGVIGRSGGTRALVDWVSARAKSRRSAMLSAWLSGLVVFFDDYANCLLVGNTIRPFSDSRKISREKLSFIVDSTAAPVATIALVSTWVGYQLGLLGDAGVELDGNAYDTFLSMLPYSFYAWFTIAFVGMIAWSQRDFGPMLRAERRAIERGEVSRPGSQPLMDTNASELEPPPGITNLPMSNALGPIAFVVLAVIVGLYVSGSKALGADADGAALRDIIGAADSYAVLLWASLGGSAVAIALALASRVLNLSEAMDAWVAGVRSMVVAVLILVLAWGIGEICKTQLQTGPWLLSQVSPDPTWMPLITFTVAAIIALSTGSSFSTMAIVIPIAAPMVWGVTDDWGVRHATLAAVLGGAVFGDHCSPISDTTIMSSMASAADHMDHVRTQTPYALVCAGVAMVIGYVPAGFGLSPWISLPVGLVALAAVVRLVGRPHSAR